MRSGSLGRCLAWLIGAGLIFVSLSACAPQSPTPTKVSQSAMSLDMVNRIQDEGNAKCQSAGGLKGIEWAFDTTPSGKMSTPLPPDPPAARGAVTDAMVALALNAPKPFLYESDSYSSALGSGLRATYVCRDGSLESSEEFEFEP